MSQILAAVGAVAPLGGIQALGLLILRLGLLILCDQDDPGSLSGMVELDDWGGVLP